MATWEEIIASPEWEELDAEEQVRARAAFYDNVVTPEALQSGVKPEELQAQREYQILNFDNGTGKIATFSKSLLKGITGMGTSAVQGLGALTGIESIERAGKEAGAFMEREVITNPSSKIANTLGGGVGSAAAFLGTMGAGGLIGKGLGFAGTASAQTAALTGGFFAGAGSGAQSADQLGMTGGDKYLRALLGGTTEVVVEKYLFGLAPELNALRRGSVGGVREFGKAIGTESIEEGVAQVAGNVADIALAPEGAKAPGVFEDVGMSMLGGAAGGALFGGLTSRKPRAVDARAAAAAAGDAGAAAVLAEAENAATLLPVPMPELTPAPEGFLPEGALDPVSADPANLFLPEDLPFTGESETALQGETEDPFAGETDIFGGAAEPGLQGETELFAPPPAPGDAQIGPPAPLPAAASFLPPVQLPEGLDVVQTGSGIWQVVDSSGAAVTPEFNAQDRDTALRFGARRVERQQAQSRLPALPQTPVQTEAPAPLPAEAAILPPADTTFVPENVTENVTAAETPAPVRQTRHRVFDGAPFLVAPGEGVLEARTPEMAFRITGEPQIEDMVATGEVRAKEGKMRGGRSGETQWTAGNAKLGYRAEGNQGRYVIQTRNEGLNDRQGGLPLSEVVSIFRSDGTAWEDVTADVMARNAAATARDDTQTEASAPSVFGKSGTEAPGHENIIEIARQKAVAAGISEEDFDGLLRYRAGHNSGDAALKAKAHLGDIQFSGLAGLTSKVSNLLAGSPDGSTAGIPILTREAEALKGRWHQATTAIQFKKGQQVESPPSVPENVPADVQTAPQGAKGVDSRSTIVLGQDLGGSREYFVEAGDKSNFATIAIGRTADGNWAVEMVKVQFTRLGFGETVYNDLNAHLAADGGVLVSAPASHMSVAVSGLWNKLVRDGKAEKVTDPIKAREYAYRMKPPAPQAPVQAAPDEKIKLTPAAEAPFTEPDLQIEAPELAQIIETGKIALPPPEYFAARRKRDLRGTNALSANEAAALKQWAAYEAIPAPSEVPRRARKTYQRLFARTGGAAVDTAVVGATYETDAAVDPNAAEAPEDTLNRIGETLLRLGDETALTEEDYFTPQIEAEKQKQREMDAAFVQAVSQGRPVKVADLARTLKSDDVIVLGDGTEAIVEAVEDDGTLNLWSETYGMQRIRPSETMGIQNVQQSPLNLYTRSAPEWAASVARQMVPGSEVIILGDNEFVEIDADPFSLGDKPAGEVPRKRRLRMEGIRGARVRINGKETVVLNKDQVTKDTPVHEVAHGLISALPADIRSRGEALMKQHGRRYLEDIRRRYTRAGVNLSEAGLMEEALVTLLGNEGVAIWDKYVRSGKARRLLMEWIAAVKTWFRDTFGYSPDITLEQWGRMQNERFLAQRRGRQRAQGGTGMSFAGAKAETPQFMRDSLETAKAMAAAGKSSEEIRALTGWFPGKYDGKMRWEIPDNKAFAKNVMLAVGQDLSRFDAGGSVQVELGSLISHPELFAAYPRLQTLPVAVNADSGVAAYTRGSPNGQDLGSIELGLSRSRQMDRRTLSRLLHEVQHAIQEIEGFAKGGDSRMAFADPRMGIGSEEGLRGATRLLKRILGDMRKPLSIEAFAKSAWQSDDVTPEIEASYRDYLATKKKAGSDPGIERLAQETAAKEWYRNLAGEIEARDVQARMEFTPEQRAATEPYSSENIAPEDAIVMGVGQRGTGATSAQYSLAPTGMASGPAGTKRLRAVFEGEYPTENFTDTEAQVLDAYQELSRRGASFDEFMATLRDMNDNTEDKWFNMSAPAFFGLMASDADARMRRAAGTFGEGKNSPAYRRAETELRRLERYQAGVAAAKGQHVKGYDLAWAMTSPERQVSAISRLHLFDGSAARLKNHDEAVAGLTKAAQEHAQAAAADIAPTDVAAQVERLVAADSAAAASDEIIDTATEETRAGITDILEGALDRASLEDRATASKFFEFLLIADVGAEFDAQGGTTQLSLADRLATMREEIRARMAKMTPAQRAAEVARAREGMKAIVAQRTSLTVRAAQAPELIAEDPQALAVFKLQKSLELLINSGKRQPKSKTKSDAETVAAAIQAALLDKAGISTKLVPGVDMATTIGLLIANQDSARQVLDQVQSQLNADPKTRGIISSGRLQAFGEAVIGRRFDTDESAPYGPNQIAKLLRDEMKAAKMDVRKLIRDAALTRMSFSVLEGQLRAPERGLESRIGPDAMNRLVAAVRAEYEKTLAQRRAEADKKRAVAKRPTTRTAPAVSPQAQQTLRARMTENGAQQLLSALRSAMEQKPADGPLNAADKALNAELSRIIREAAAEATEGKPTDPIDKLISQLGIPELRQERLDLLDQLVDEKIGTTEDPVQAAALRDAWITASEELRTRNVSKSTAARMVSRSIKGKDRNGLRDAVRDGNELAITAIGERAVAQAIGAVRERVSADPGMQATTTDAQIDALAADFQAAFGDIVEAARLRASEKARIEFRKEQIAQGLGVALTDTEKSDLLAQKPENLLDYVLKQFGFDYKTLASKFITEAKGEAGLRAAVDQLAAQLGLDPDQAELFARPLIQRALAAMPEARRAALQATLKTKIDKVAGKVIKRGRRKEDNERLVEAIELGALDEGTLDPVLQHITGVADISPAMKTHMLAIVRRMQGDISPTQHATLRAGLMHVIQGARGVPLGGLVGDTTMAHIFGGGNTMKINVIAGLVKFIFDSPALFYSAVRGASGLTKLTGTQKRQAIAAMVGSTRQAFTREGLSMAERMFRDGIGPAQDDLSIYGESTNLETLHNSPAALIRLPGGKFLSPRATNAIRTITQLHPYVRRAMAATDLLYRAPAHQILKGQQAVLAIRDEASGGGRPLPKTAAEWRARIDEVNYGRPFPQAVAEARTTADAEVAAGTLDQKNYYQRTADLLDGMMADAYGLTSDYRPKMTGAERLAEIRERAKRIGFANRTTGVIGGVANVAKQLTAQFPAMRILLPAVNVPMNALNQALDWTPWGFVRSWIGTRSSRGTAMRTPTMSVSRYIMESAAKVPTGWLAMDEVVNEETIAEMRFRAVAGTAIMAVVAAAVAQSFDEDEEEATIYITAQGPEDKAEKKAWMDRGFKPYHIYFNGTGVNFFETPLNSVLTSIGAWSDAHRYAPNDMDKADKAVFAMTRTAVATADASVLATLADLLGIVKGGSTASAVDGFKKITSRAAASVVAPNLFREFNAFYYGKQDGKQQSWAGNALATVPFIYNLGFDSRPALNVFGEPLQPGSTAGKGVAAVVPMLAHRLVTNVLDDPQMHFVARHGINTYVTRRRMLDGTEIEDDYNTMRAWVQNSGKRLRAELTPEYMQSIDTLAETDKERAEELFDAFVKRIRDAELDALPGVAPRGT